MYLFLLKGRKERRRDREKDLPSIDSPLKQLQWPELSQSEARSLEFLLGLPHAFRVPKLWAILNCFLGHK